MAFLASTAVLCSKVQAADVEWIGYSGGGNPSGQSGSWFNGFMWLGLNDPATGDIAIFDTRNRGTNDLITDIHFATYTMQFSDGTNPVTTTGGNEFISGLRVENGTWSYLLGGQSLTVGASDVVLGGSPVGGSPLFASSLTVENGLMRSTDDFFIGGTSTQSHSVPSRLFAQSGAELRADDRFVIWSGSIVGISTNSTLQADRLEILGGQLSVDGTLNAFDEFAIEAGTFFLRPGRSVSGTDLMLGPNAFIRPTVSLSGAQTTSITSTSASLSGTTTIEVPTGDTFQLNAPLANGSTAGALTKIGTGTLTLTGANSYTGGTTITAGTVVGNTTSLQGAIANSGSLIFNQSTSGTYAGSISGTGSLTKQGSGAVTISGSNTYTGATVIDGGTLALGGNSRLSDLTDLTVSAGATFDLGNFAEAIDGLSGGGRVTTTSSTARLIVGSNNGNSTFSGTIEGSGRLEKRGAGTLALTGANSYTGTTVITDGTLALGGNNRLSDLTDLNVGSGAAFSLGSFTEAIDGLSGGGRVTTTSSTARLIVGSNNGNSTFSGTIEGSGRLEKRGTGTQVLTGANSYTGGTTITAGAIVGNTTSLQGAIANSGRLIFDQNTPGTYSGSVSGTGFLVKRGSGAVTISGSNTYTGETVIDGGRLALGGNSRLSDLTDLTVSAGATFDLGNFAEAVDELSGDGRVTSNSGPTSARLILGSDNGNATFDGTIEGGLRLEKRGTGTLTLTGANSYTGTTTVFGGTLALGGNSVLSDQTDLNVGANSVFSLGDFSDAIDSLVGSGRVTSNPGPTPARLIVGANNGNATFDGTIEGGLRLEKRGTGTLTLTGANSYTGTTVIVDGTLALGANSVLSDQTDLNVGANAVFSLGNFSDVIDSLVGSGRVTSNPGPTSARLIVGANNGNATFDGTIEGGLRLEKRGTGTLTLTGANSYTGTTTIFGGTLALGANSVLSDVTDLNVGANAVFSLGDFSDVIDSLVGSGRVTSNPGPTSARLIVGANNGNATFDGTIEGGLRLEKRGTGTLTLTGANSYTGTTVIIDGTLALGTNSVLSDQTDLNVGANAVFSLGDFSEAVDSLVGSGRVTSNPGPTSARLIVGANNGNATFDGTIEGGLRLEKRGTGTLTLTGANSYTGTTVIIDGTLALGTNSVLSDQTDLNVGANSVFSLGNFAEAVDSLVGSGRVTSNPGPTSARLIVGANNGNATFDGTIEGGLRFEKRGTGTLTLTGANSYTGTTTIFGGTLALGANSVLSDATDLNVGANGILSLGDFAEAIDGLVGSGRITSNAGPTSARLIVGSDNGNSTFTGTLDGGLRFEKRGTGTLALTGANSYTGTTTISDGILTLAQAFLDDEADVRLEDPSTLNLDFIGIDTINQFVLNGFSRAVGTHGAIGSGADFEWDQITGSGLLQVTSFSGLSGDYNSDGIVDAADYTVWRDSVGMPAGTLVNDPNAGSIGQLQYDTWVANFGATATNTFAVPEPYSAVLLLSCLLPACRRGGLNQA